MSDSIRLATFKMVVAAFLPAGGAFAHGGADVPLFVAENGDDRGRCLDEAAPCRSLGYALSVAGKGAQIRLAEGSYAVENPEDLFHVVSGMIEVTGGFERSGERFVNRNGVSTLIGVPPRFRPLLKNRGVNVVSDRKAIEGPQAAETEKLVDLYQKLKSGAAASPCTNGMAGDLSCEAVDLLSHVSFDDLGARPSSMANLWGFVDLNTGREYVVAGYNVGTAVFDITDAENPAEVGFIDGQTSAWREVKVYQFFDADDDRWRAFAYVTTDASTDGLFVIDMSDLPHAIRKTSYSSDYFAAHTVYVTSTDYSTGIATTNTPPLLVIAGSNLDSGQFRAYSLANPAAPELVAGAGSPDYMHDSSSFTITDSRKDSQCVNGGDWCEVLFDFNEGTIDVWDITDPADPERLSRTAYANVGYIHSGWWSEDKLYLFVHDEFDEQDFQLNSTLRVFSLADLRAPVLAGTWEGPTSAIDHNGYVRGNRYYMSNYSRGLTVLDITNPPAPVTAGSLDTYPFSDSSSFVGAWGVYPFFFSGTVAISDIDTGLYLARDRSVEVAQGQLSFGSRSYAGDEGQSVALTVRRTGGSTGAVSVAFEVVHATADADDWQVASGMLDWPGGDASDRAIDVALVNDASTEGLERLLVRLVDPRGGATLGPQNVASVYASDPGNAAEVGFFADSVDISERGFATAVLVLQRSGSAVGPASVDFAMGVGDAVAGADFDGTTSGTVAWPAGDGEPKTLLFTITDDDLDEETEFAEVSLSNATGAAILGSPNATIAIANGRGSNLAPNAVAGGSQTVSGGATVMLDGGQSNDPGGDSLTFQWTQTSGPQVTLSGAATAIAQFTAPTVSSDTMLRFTLTASDPAGLSDSATTVVTVMTSDEGGGGGGVSVVLILLCLTALARRAAAIRVNRMDVA